MVWKLDGLLLLMIRDENDADENMVENIEY